LGDLPFYFKVTEKNDNEIYRCKNMIGQSEEGAAYAATDAEMALALKRLTGSVVRRRGTYTKASAACIEEFMSSRW